MRSTGLTVQKLSLLQNNLNSFVTPAKQLKTRSTRTMKDEASKGVVRKLAKAAPGPVHGKAFNMRLKGLTAQRLSLLQNNLNNFSASAKQLKRGQAER